MAYGSSALSIIALICAVWVIYDVFTQNKKLTNRMKIMWVVLAIVFNILAAIVYYFMYKK